MTKFNATKERETVTNYMGHKAYKNAPRLELVNAVLSSFIENSYYEKAEKRLSRISGLVESVGAKDPEFVAKLAIFARDEFHMRSSYHALIGELAKVHKGDSLVAKTIEVSVQRPDDLTEIVAYLGKPIPNQVKKGVARAMKQFDKYQLGKYQGNNKTFTLADVVRLVRPHPGRGMKLTYKALAAGELRNKETWESRLTAGEKKDVVFKDLLQNHKLGYMATLRNLRGIVQTGDSETVELALKFITNRKAVENSKQLPFRFLSAYDALSEIRHGAKSGIAFEKDDFDVDEVFEALEKAAGYSVDNIPLLTGKTFILSDNSGSMGGDAGGQSIVSAYSSRTMASIANLFAVLYWTRADNTAIGLFGDRLITPKLDREAGIFDNYKTLARAAEGCGGATEQGIFDAFRKLVDEKQKVDRIVIFSDMQIGKNSWYGMGARDRGGTFNTIYQSYMKMFPDTLVYSVDLKGYGNTVIGSNVLELSGWSDKIFDVMQIMESDRNGLIHRINAIQL